MDCCCFQPSLSKKAGFFPSFSKETIPLSQHSEKNKEQNKRILNKDVYLTMVDL
jgi:hypothetical protein